MGSDIRTIQHELTVRVRSTSREAVRREVVGWWLDEESGDRFERHCYTYYVDELSDGSRIFLERPARLNKGMDFVIKCESFIRHKTVDKWAPPSHNHLRTEIDALLKAGVEELRLRDSLRRVWLCEDVGAVMETVDVRIHSIQLERVLYLAKWFFIEQDLTYWTDSGRWKPREFLEVSVGLF